MAYRVEYSRVLLLLSIFFFSSAANVFGNAKALHGKFDATPNACRQRLIQMGFKELLYSPHRALQLPIDTNERLPALLHERNPNWLEADLDTIPKDKYENAAQIIWQAYYRKVLARSGFLQFYMDLIENEEIQSYLPVDHAAI